MYFDWEKRTGTLVIWLRKRYWGRGYSGERAEALAEVTFERLDLDLVAAEVEAGNENSRRAVEKYINELGGQYDGVLRNWVTQGDDVLDLHRYTVSSEQYQTDG